MVRSISCIIWPRESDTNRGGPISSTIWLRESDIERVAGSISCTVLISNAALSLALLLICHAASGYGAIRATIAVLSGFVGSDGGGNAVTCCVFFF